MKKIKLIKTLQPKLYVARRLIIDNWRWAKVPILLRTELGMKKDIHYEIAIQSS